MNVSVGDDRKVEMELGLFSATASQTLHLSPSITLRPTYYLHLRAESSRTLKYHGSDLKIIL